MSAWVAAQRPPETSGDNRKHGLYVIEDAAQAPGLLYKGRPVGALGGFSLNFHKHIHAGEGGVIVTQSETLAERCRLIRNHGENASEGRGDYDISHIVGSNCRLTELLAAIGTEQLRRLEGYLKHRARFAAHLRRRLRKIPGLTPQEAPRDAGSTHANYVYPIRYDARITGLSRSLFVRAVNVEFPVPGSVESIPLTKGTCVRSTSTRFTGSVRSSAAFPSTSSSRRVHMSNACVLSPSVCMSRSLS